MSVEAPTRLTTLTYLKYEAVIKPDAGGRVEPASALNDTTILVQQIDSRIIPPIEPLRVDYQPVELVPNLAMNHIPKWHMRMEMSRFLRDINTGLEQGKTLEEAVSKSAFELEMNIRAYHAEITKSKATLLHLTRFESREGVVRMVGSNGKPVVDAISPKERRGAVLTGSRKVEESLVAAENNSFAVLMSPAGWNGFTDQYGNETSPHLNSQALVFWKDPNGDLKGLTFHIDLEYEQAKRMMLGLGISEEDLNGETEKDRIVNMVKNPAFCSLPAAYANPFEYVLDKIIAERGTSPFRLLQQNGVEIRTIEEVREDIKRFDQLLTGSQEEERLINELKGLILQQASRVKERIVQQQIIDSVEKTILRLARGYLQQTGQLPVYHPNAVSELGNYKTSARGDNEFGLVIAFLETRAGCPSSVVARALAGVSLGSISGVSIGGGSSFVESDQDGPLEFSCHNCEATLRRPRGGRLSSCHNCGVKFAC